MMKINMFILFILTIRVYSNFLYKKINFTVQNAPTATFERRSSIKCATICSSGPMSADCSAFSIDSFGICDIYNLTDLILTPVDERSTERLYFSTSVAIPYRALNADIRGWFGEWLPVVQCDRNTAVIGIKIWGDSFTDKALDTEDDFGISKIKVMCKDENHSQLNNYFIGGFGYNAQSEGPYICPGKSHVNRYRFAIQNEIRSTAEFADNNGMVSMDFGCDDVNSTTFESVTGRDEPPDQVKWSSWAVCDYGFKVCGVSVVFDPIVGPSNDSTAVNEVAGLCCFIM